MAKTHAEIRAEGAQMLLEALGLNAEQLAQVASGVAARKAPAPAPRHREVKVTRNTGEDAETFGVATISKMVQIRGKDTWVPKVGIKREDLASVIKALTTIYKAIKAEEEEAQAK